jgi:hypothetical protein
VRVAGGTADIDLEQLLKADGGFIRHPAAQVGFLVCRRGISQLAFL